ncbi:MAG TPA: hypothetical protein VFE47_31965 [Tepidisphaeraceae bacterium]|jgi:hypothetical protein|nr:hypothetical protein [Tepidisphaeraceae bacterium]
MEDRKSPAEDAEAYDDGPMADDPAPLDYYAGKAPARQYSAIVALLLCTPGATEFALYFSLRSDALQSAVPRILADLFWPLLALAIVTAITSIVIYARRPRDTLPWYVILNLVINIVGLLFAAVYLVQIF